MDHRRHQGAGRRTHRNSRTWGAAGLVALTLSGCGSIDEPADAPRTPPPITSSASSTPTPVQSAGDHDVGTLEYTPGPSRPPATAARRTAEKFAQLWARHDVAAARWWGDLKPLCTPKLHQQLRVTDPASVPADAIIGRAKAVVSRQDEAVFHLQASSGGTLILGTAKLEHLGWRVVTVDFQRSS